MIKFSVITCTFRAEKTLQRTLDSVADQTCRRVEHLIIDGASDDATMDLARAYQAKTAEEDNDHEVILISEPDKGLYDAMNKGIKKATGDYIIFMNAGDTFASPDTLELIAGSIGDGETLPGVLYGDTDIVNNDGHFVRHRRLQPPEELTWKSFRHGMLVCHQAFYARTDLARKTPYDTRYKYSADVDWCIRVMKEAAREQLPLKNVGMVVAHYLDEGMTTANHKASLKERFRVMAHHYGWLSTTAMHLWFIVRSFFKK